MSLLRYSGSRDKIKSIGECVIAPVYKARLIKSPTLLWGSVEDCW